MQLSCSKRPRILEMPVALLPRTAAAMEWNWPELRERSVWAAACGARKKDPGPLEETRRL